MRKIIFSVICFISVMFFSACDPMIIPDSDAENFAWYEDTSGGEMKKTDAPELLTPVVKNDKIYLYWKHEDFGKYDIKYTINIQYKNTVSDSLYGSYISSGNDGQYDVTLDNNCAFVIDNPLHKYNYTFNLSASINDEDSYPSFSSNSQSILFESSKLPASNVSICGPSNNAVGFVIEKNFYLSTPNTYTLETKLYKMPGDVLVTSYSSNNSSSSSSFDFSFKSLMSNTNYKFITKYYYLKENKNILNMNGGSRTITTKMESEPTTIEFKTTNYGKIKFLCKSGEDNIVYGYDIDYSKIVKINTVQKVIESSYSASITNPSDMKYSSSNNKLYIISESDNKIYMFDLSSNTLSSPGTISVISTNYGKCLAVDDDRIFVGIKSAAKLSIIAKSDYIIKSDAGTLKEFKSLKSEIFNSTKYLYGLTSDGMYRYTVASDSPVNDKTISISNSYTDCPITNQQYITANNMYSYSTKSVSLYNQSDFTLAKKINMVGSTLYEMIFSNDNSYLYVIHNNIAASYNIATNENVKTISFPLANLINYDSNSISSCLDKSGNVLVVSLIDSDNYSGLIFFSNLK